MDHDYDVGACGQRLTVAGLLVAAVAKIAIVHKYRQPQLPGEVSGIVLAVVVHQDADVHQLGDLPHRRFQRAFCIVSRHYHSYALSVDHGPSLSPTGGLSIP